MQWELIVPPPKPIHGPNKVSPPLIMLNASVIENGRSSIRISIYAHNIEGAPPWLALGKSVSVYRGAGAASRQLRIAPGAHWPLAESKMGKPTKAPRPIFIKVPGWHGLKHAKPTRAVFNITPGELTITLPPSFFLEETAEPPQAPRQAAPPLPPVLSNARPAAPPPVKREPHKGLLGDSLLTR